MLVERGWHTDIALAADRLPPSLGPALRANFPGARYLVFGFGDRAYFMARETSFIGMVEALFPGPAVILVTGLAATPEQAFGAGHVLKLDPPPAGIAGLGRFLDTSIVENADGSPRLLGDGPYPGSLFYEASADYALFHNCNRWTAEALASAGLAVDPDGVLSAADIAGRALAAEALRPAPEDRRTNAGPGFPQSGEATASRRSEEKNTVMSGGN